METITAFDPIRIAKETFVLPAFLPLPGMGILPMHAYVILAERPTLVDAGPGPLAESFLGRLAKVVDPRDIQYLFSTHADPDHTGALTRVLDASPECKVVTSFLGAGKLGLGLGVPPERTHLINPGQSLCLGDRELAVLRPPVYDAPESVMAFDRASGALFTADCFGALMHAAHMDVSAIPPDQRREGMLTWASVDAPWLADLPRDALRQPLQDLRDLAPDLILGAHLPPAEGNMLESLLDDLGDAPGLTPFVGPDQAAMEAAMAATAAE